MFQNFLAVPLHFTVEFLGFLVCAGGAFLVVSRATLVPGPASNRITAALGLGALAAAQVIHGGSFISLDGDSVLIGVYSIGFAFLGVSLAGAVRPGMTAILGLPIEQPLALAPAGTAFFLAVVATMGALRGGTRALWRLAAAGALLGLSQVFMALAPAAEFGVGEVQTYSNLAHGAKALGFLFLGAWLWSSVRASIRVRFVASFAGLLLVVVLVLSSSLTGVISNNVEEQQLQNTSAQLAGIASAYAEDDLVELTDAASVVAGDPHSSEAMRGNPKASEVEALAGEFVGEEGRDLSFVVFIKGDIIGFAGTGPDLGPKGDAESLKKYLVPLAGSSVVDSASRPGPVAANPDLVGGVPAVIAAAEIVPDQGETPLGVVVVGRFIDVLEIERIADIARPSDASLIVEGKVIASGLPKKIARRLKAPGEVVAQIRLGRPAALPQPIGSSTYFNAFAPLLNDREQPLDDTILVLSSPARIVSATTDVTTILFLVAMGIGAVVLALAWFSGRRITRPIQSLTAAAGAVREGDLSARAKVSGVDEVGQLGETFNEMTSALLRSTNDLREAAEEEQRLRTRIETIIHSMADGLVAVGADKKVLAFNPQAEALTGIKTAAAVGKPIEKVLDARDAHGTRFPLPIYELAEGSVDGIYLTRKSGDRVPVSVDSAILRGPNGEAAGGVAVVRDMTREREVERMKSEFLSNISHELRTPLTPIKGYAEILGNRDVPPEKAKQFAGGILDSTARLERIVELLVDFSALEAGRMMPRTKPVDVGGIIESLAENTRKRAKRHEVVVDVKARLPKVIGDERLLRRSIEEVLDNAVKFSPDGGTIRLEAKGGSTSNGRKRKAVEVTITDQGIGIAPEDLSNIFSDFHQLDGSETRSFGGLGLGLAFVQRIIEAHNGSIDVSSELDKGTRLTITIPAAGRTSPG